MAPTPPSPHVVNINATHTLARLRVESRTAPLQIATGWRRLMMRRQGRLDQGVTGRRRRRMVGQANEPGNSTRRAVTLACEPGTGVAVGMLAGSGGACAHGRRGALPLAV